MKKIILNLVLITGTGCATKSLPAAELATLAAFTTVGIQTIDIIGQIEAAIEARLFMIPEYHREELRPSVAAEVWEEMTTMPDVPERRYFVDAKAGHSTPSSPATAGNRRRTPSKYNSKKYYQATHNQLKQPRNKH